MADPTDVLDSPADGLTPGLTPEGVARAALLLLYWNRWTHRRTETITFIDDNHARRSQTVDFTTSAELAVGDAATLAPLALLEKRTLRNFDLRGAAGEALPMVTRHESQALGRAILVAAASSALDKPPQEVSELAELKEVLGIVAGTREEAQPVIAALQEERGPAAAYAEKLKKAEGGAFRVLAGDMAGSFVMYGMLATGGPSRRLAKFAYDEPLSRERLQRRRLRRWMRVTARLLLRRARKRIGWLLTPFSKEYWRNNRVRGVARDCLRLLGRLLAAVFSFLCRILLWLGRLVAAIVRGVREPWRTLSTAVRRPVRLWRWLAIATVDFKFPAPHVSLSESYHVEIEAPDDLVIELAALYEPLEPGQRAEDLKLFGDPTLSTDRAHLHVRDLPRGTSGEILVRFRVRSTRILLAARNISWATSGVLAIGLVLHGFGVPSHPGVASLLLVALPGVFATYLARPGAHRLVERLVSGVQVIIGSQAVLSFVAAASLAVGLNTGWRVGIWGTCLFVSALGSIAMWLANRRAARIEQAEPPATG